MRIEKIKVTGLFDRFDHELVFPENERVTIMIAPNGFGKTMILRIINALFNQPIRTLSRLPFRKLLIQFDDGSNLNAIRKERQSKEEERASRFEVDIRYEPREGHSQAYLSTQELSVDEVGIPIGVIEDIVPQLDQIGGARWRDLSTGEILGLDEVFDRYGDQLPINSGPRSKVPSWLRDIRKGIPVHFIDTERLTQPLKSVGRVRRARHTSTSFTDRTVRQYSEELGESVQQTLSEYGALSQSLDRTFPARLVEEPVQAGFTMESLRSELAEVESKRRKLVDAGLLAQDTAAWGVTIPNIENVDESRREVLAVYARDAKQKLSVFDEVLAKVDALKRIANSRFLHKRISIGTSGLIVRASDGKKLELEMLSSGEQHELVLLYDLLFRVRKDSFILIDEPELSLHVAWQEKFLDDIEEIAELSDFRVLLATHSPQIIGDRFDLTVELKGPK